MKKYLTLFSLAAIVLAGCSKDDDNNGGGGGDETGLVFVENGVHYLGNGNQNYRPAVGDYVLDASTAYVLRGWVYIQEGSSITIPAGTVIKGKSTDNTIKGSSLIIERGAKIHAIGTPSQPIVFTSDKPAGQRKPGDWGGIIICGRARNNLGTDNIIEGGPSALHGGTVDNDNSGELQYVRIEFCGYPFQTDKEVNGLTMGSVGSQTKIDHVQISYSNDDSFEWFGGTVNCDHLIAYHGWDDDFDTDNGFSGRVQYVLGVRHPKLADTSCSNGFESDNNSSGALTEPFTTTQFCNVTLVGPIGQAADFVNQASYIDGGTMDPNNGSRKGIFQSAFQIRRSSKLQLCNAAVIGWPIGAIIDSEAGQSQTYATQSNSTVKNVFFGGYTDNAAGAAYDNTAQGAATILGADRNNKFIDALQESGQTANDPSQKSFSHTYVLGAGRGNQAVAMNSLNLSDPRSVTSSAFTPNPAANYGPKAGSVLIGTFTVPTGFDTAGSAYAGAFKSDASADNWTAGWADFDPQNKSY